MYKRVNARSGMLVTACAAAIIGFVQAAAGQSLPVAPQEIQKAGELRVGVKCDSPPAGYLDASGKHVGIEVEMARKIAELMFGSKDKAVLQCVTADNRIPTLQGKRIDLIIATLGKYPEREKVIGFSEPYFWGESNIIVPKDSSITKLADLKGKNVLVIKGGAQAKWLEANIPEIKFTRLNSTGDSIQAMRQGRGDAYAGDASLIFTLKASNPDLRVLDEGYDFGVQGIGMRKGEDDLKAFVDAAIKHMRESGFYREAARNLISDPTVLEQTLYFFETAPPKS